MTGAERLARAAAAVAAVPMLIVRLRGRKTIRVVLEVTTPATGAVRLLPGNPMTMHGPTYRTRVLPRLIRAWSNVYAGEPVTLVVIVQWQPIEGTRLAFDAYPDPGAWKSIRVPI